MSSGREAGGWLARATTQFARTVYTELRRAGHGKGDIVRFINELMDLLSKDAEAPVAPPTLRDPEAGLPDADTMHDIVEFELRIRPKDRRQEERLVVATIDVILPSWTPATARQRTHELLAVALARELRAGDSLGQLGPDRYLLVLPRSKDAVRSSVHGRLTRALDKLVDELADGLQLELRWATAGSGGTGAIAAASAVELLQHCFASTAELLKPAAGAGGARAQPARARTPSDRAGGRDIVLALGGGAARAVSHAGALQVLTAAGLRPIAVAGCSAGAIVGAMFARGVAPEAIVARFIEFGASPIYAEMRRAYADFLRETKTSAGRTRSRYFGSSSLAFSSDTKLAIMPGDLLGRFVEHFLGADCDISTLRIPFAVVATDLVEGRPMRMAHGSLHAAVAASCAVPGLFPPVQIGERILVDGSDVTEVPIWTAELFGLAAPLLAIHMGRPFHRVTAYQTGREVSTRSNALIHAELVREQLRRADLLLTVPVEDVGWLDFRLARKIAEIGRQAAEDALPLILARHDEHDARKATP